jgi:hypothetical protein
MTIYFKFILFFLLINLGCLFVASLHIFPPGALPMSEADYATAYGITGSSTAEQVINFFAGNNWMNLLMVTLGTGLMAASLIYNDIRPVVIVGVAALFYNFFVTSKSFFDNIIAGQHNQALNVLYLMLGVAMLFIFGITIVEWYLGRAPSDD